MACLFVGNLMKTVSETKLMNIFRSYGKCKVDLKVNKSYDNKGPYAFIEYDDSECATRALKDLNRTNLNGANGQARVRIEYSHKRKINDKLENNELALDEEVNFLEESEDNRKKSPARDVESKKSNVCFICRLPGHFAKECVLTKESCYECGEKGHIAKECQMRVREAKTLTESRVKAITSQQSVYKYISTGVKMNNVINYLQINKT